MNYMAYIYQISNIYKIYALTSPNSNLTPMSKTLIQSIKFQLNWIYGAFQNLKMWSIRFLLIYFLISIEMCNNLIELHCGGQNEPHHGIWRRMVQAGLSTVKHLSGVAPFSVKGEGRAWVAVRSFDPKNSINQKKLYLFSYYENEFKTSIRKLV